MNLFIITSVINICNNPFSYINTRSFCSIEQRFNDTKKTIESIRKYVPNCKILIVECSFLSEEYEKILIENSDYYINLSCFDDILENTKSYSKSLGEGSMTIEILRYIMLNHVEFEKFNNIFKISGRYWLNEKFNFSVYDNNNYIFKKIKDNENNIFTCFYKIPKQGIKSLFYFLKNSTQDFNNCIGYEVIFSKFIKNILKDENVKYISDKIGINGYVSVCGTYGVF